LVDRSAPKTVPNFLIVGAPKCGTTSVYQYLRSHPEAFLPARKESNYFCARETFGIATRDAYLALFRPGSGKKAVGEASVNYLYEPDAPRRIRSLLGADVKILIFVRHPVRLIHSQWGQYVQSGVENLDFQAALDAIPSRLSDSRFAQNCSGWQALFDYLDRARYSRHVERYRDMFGDKLRVFVFEEFFQPGLPQYPALCDFLGIDAGHRPDGLNHNPAGGVRVRWLSRLMADWAPWQDPLRALIPHNIRAHVSGTVRRLNAIERPLPPLSPELAGRLWMELSPDIPRLERILGRSLGDVWRMPDVKER
jgi:Sulfotransferase domain